jgi:hypothetical protein
MLELRVTKDRHLQGVPIQETDLLEECGAVTNLTAVPLPCRLREKPT